VPNQPRYPIKYPRTVHLPWSEGVASDDIRKTDVKDFVGKQIIVTEKMDGENTTLYADRLHARSVDSKNHPSRDWVKQFHSGIKHDIPEGWRICGENLYARHSVEYDELPTYFMGFSMWDEHNICQSWKDTLEWFKLIGITPVPVLFSGVFNEVALRTLAKTMDLSRSEGYVVRNAGSFPYSAFDKNVAKFVRANHVQSTVHWMHQNVNPNKLSRS